MTRTRTLTVPNPSDGIYQMFTTGITWYNNNSSSIYLDQSVCTDELGPSTDHALSITHRYNDGISPLNGTRYSLNGSPHSTMTNYRPDAFSNFVVSHASLPAAASEATAATLALARTNPNRISVGVPQLLYELRDLPGMYRDIMAYKLNLKRKGTNPRDVANHYLAAQMGWLPLVSDIRKLLDFQSLADKRMRELERLYSKGGLKRRFKHGGDTAFAEAVVNSTIISVGNTISVQRAVSTTRRRWSTIRWQPSSLPSTRYTSQQLNRLSRRLVLGLSLGQSAVQVWNVIPWTWLIGWAANCDDYIAAHNNTVPVSHGNVNVMTETITTEVWRRTDARQAEFQGAIGTRSLHQKQRAIVAGPVLTATLPFLSGRQLSILAALAIQRIR